MQNTWLVNFKFNTNEINLQFLEFYYFYNYLLKKFNIFIYYKYKYFLFKFCKKNKFFFSVLNTNTSLTVFNNKLTSKYLSFKINYQILNLTEQLSQDNIIVKNYFSDKKYKYIRLKLFNLFFLFNYSLFNNHAGYHYEFKLFFVQNIKKKIAIISLNKFLTRWNDACDLLFNVFFYNFKPLIFSSPFFKNETLALNWSYNHFEINLWKYYFPFFIFRLNSYNNKTDFFFSRLSIYNINFFLITDCFYHFKNLHYLKKKKYYTIGLIDASMDPWVVTYPIISFFENFLIQSFFFKLLILVQKQIFMIKFLQFKNIWFNFLTVKTNFYLYNKPIK